MPATRPIESLVNGAVAEFRAKDIGLRAQKKLLSRMSNKTVAKAFIDDVSAGLLDSLYRLVKQLTGNKKDAEKLTKNMIKMVVKVGVLHRNEQFSPEELQLGRDLQRKLRSLAMSVVSFHEVDYSYDRQYLLGAVQECGALLKDLVRHHLTPKSLVRVDHVFGFFGTPETLDAVFRADSVHRDSLARVVADLHKALDQGSL
ncbi:tumor necrosis factor induced protein, putative [Ixodes scapularis]|uniref:Tumor necrosis factor induced protein, putative n=1 Tax=Ixodes scapularis TaxID=6945 RepID=B7Q629_IXOSC|nr:tumor necrosis factor induced protein, putative [Ixodes scapularis]|eukprot:XP_002411876.1 tumor necrosis factor induced protein, putative [Ixodes scapularis]